MGHDSPPAGWTLERLDAVCQISPPRPAMVRAEDQLTSYLPLSGVGAESGQLLHYEMRRYRDVRGHRCFLEGDVLLARISPSLENGKSVVARSVPDGIGFGSTEWIVLRPGQRVSADWLHTFLRRRSFRLQARAFMFGSTGMYLRLQPQALAGMQIPLPPGLGLQSRILTRVEALRSDLYKARQLTERIAAESEQVMKAARRQLFGRLEAIKTQTPLGFAVVAGRAVARADDGVGLPVITAEHVRRPESRHQYHDGSAKANYVARDGTVLITRSGPPAVRLWRGAAAYLDVSVIAVHPDRSTLVPEYLYHALLYCADREQLAGGITVAKLRALAIPLPSLVEQMRMANYLGAIQMDVQAVSAQNQQTAQSLSSLEEGILEQAFRGEL